MRVEHELENKPFTAHELAKELLNGPDIEVAILDGFNGGGDPRMINFGPGIKDVNDEFMELDTNDIRTKEGNIIVLGYGCY